MKRRDEIDEELVQLRKLVDRLTDSRIIEGVKNLIADLEAEKATLPPDAK